MERKIVFWMLGGCSVGKTTQHRMLIESLQDEKEGKLIQGVENDLNYIYTRFSNVATLGKLGLNQCTGIDAVYSKLKGDGVALSLKKALEDKKVDFVIVECLFSSMKWLSRWEDIGIRNKMKLLVVHLSIPLWDNFMRLNQRRAKKEGTKEWWNLRIEDNTFLRVGSKNKENRVNYSKLLNKADKIIEVDAVQNAVEIHGKILKFIMENI